MDSNSRAVSRRRLLAAAAAGSAVAVAGSASARAAPGVPTHTTPLVLRDRIGGAVTRLPGGLAGAYTVDFHDRLDEWLRFWFANAPGAWRAPLEVAGQVPAGGRTFLLTAIRYTRADRLTVGFDAATRNEAYWATLASLHRYFPVVSPEPTQVRVEDGHAGFTGSAEQLAFLGEADRRLWRGNPAAADVTSRAGWHAYTRATLRLGLGSEPI
jgi:hypothetical protein